MTGSDYPRMRSRAQVAADGGGIECHMEAHALVAELDAMRLVNTYAVRLLGRRGRRRLRRALQAAGVVPGGAS